MIFSKVDLIRILNRPNTEIRDVEFGVCVDGNTSIVSRFDILAPIHSFEGAKKGLMNYIRYGEPIERSSIEPKKIIKSGPCTIVIWEDGTKTIVRLREGEKDDEFAAFSAAVVKKLYGSNSAVTKLLKKKTYVQEKKETSGDVIPKMLRDLGEAIKKKAPVQEKKED